MTRVRTTRLLVAAATLVTIATAGADASRAPAVAHAASPPGAAYQPLPPARILDTREGLGAAASAVGAGASIELTVIGAGGVPATGVGAVVLNLTGTDPTAPTFVSAYPTGGQREGSNLNLQAGQTTSNLAVVAVGEGGRVSLYNGFGSVHLIADVAGWFPTGDTYAPLTPARILDTRTGLGAPQSPVGQGASINLTVTGAGAVPASGVGAVVLNVTGTNPTAPTFVTAYPTGDTRAGSNLNLQPDQTDSSLVIATVGAGGQVSLYNAIGTTDLIADVAGWFPTDSPYGALAPARILDTREGLGASTAKVGENAGIDVTVTGVGGVPAEGVGAVVLNVTGTDPTAATFVSAYPTGGAREGSSLNLLAGETTSNLVIATVGAGGKVSLYNAFGTTDLIADVTGWFPGVPTDQPPPPPDLGTLWAQGNSSLYSYEVSSGLAKWTGHSLWYEEFTVVSELREFVLATEDIQTDPFSIRIDVRDLDSKAIKESFVWDTAGWWEVDEFIASSDGHYFAGLFGDILPEALEIYDRHTGEYYVFDAAEDTKFTSIAFTPDNDLVVAHDTTGLDTGANALIYLMTEDDYTAGTFAPIGFEAFPTTVPSDLEVSKDGTQILFSDNRQLFVMDLDPGAGPQLVASGPDPIEGGQFSPDGSLIAANRHSVASLFQAQYVFPNDPAHPVVLDDTSGEPYLLLEDNLVREIIAWEP